MSLVTEKDMDLRWACGNADAARLIGVLGRASQLADAFVDGDMEELGFSTESRSGAMTELILLLMGLDTNPFWRENHMHLRPMAISAVLQWDAANTWAESKEEKTRMYAWAWREALDQTIVMVAFLTGGLEHARKTAHEVMHWYHERHSEPFDVWDKERK